MTARTFADLYRAQAAEFPPECRSGDDERRIQNAYPIHPEIFDRLYGDWSTLLKFQRARRIAADGGGDPQPLGEGRPLTADPAVEVTVTLEIDARLPNGATDQLVRTVTENSRTLKFDSHGFEPE